MNDKKCKLTNKAFQTILEDLEGKLYKMWVDKASKFQNRSIKLWSESNNFEIYSIHSEGKSAVAKQLIRTLKNKIYEYLIFRYKK